jgi:phosphate transport system protein
MRVTLQEELDQLEAALQEEGELVLRALRGSLGALERQDVELADEVIAFDDEVDYAYVAIEEGIQSLLARQTPVAVDLRLVLAMLHVNLHLERMADYGVTIAKLVKITQGMPSDPRLLERSRRWAIAPTRCSASRSTRSRRGTSRVRRLSSSSTS